MLGLAFAGTLGPLPTAEDADACVGRLFPTALSPADSVASAPDGVDASVASGDVAASVDVVAPVDYVASVEAAVEPHED